MNLPSILSVLLCIGNAVSHIALAEVQSPEKSGPKRGASIRMELLAVALKESDALDLIPSVTQSEHLDSALKRIHALIAKEDAILLGCPILLTRSGQRALADMTTTKRYRTESPGGCPIGVFQESMADRMLPSISIPLSIFESTKVGILLEAEAEWLPGRESIRANVVVSYLQFLGYDRYEPVDEGFGYALKLDRPQLGSIKLQSHAHFALGRQYLLGMQKLQEPKDHIAMFFLRMSEL